MRSISCAFLLHLLLGIGQIHAGAITLDFDPLTVPNSVFAELSVTSPYVEDGFQITGPLLGTTTAADLSGTPRAAFQGSAGLHSQSGGAMVLTRLSANPFDLLSVDYAHSGNPQIEKTLTVTGITVSGQSVSESIKLISGLNFSDFPGYRTLLLDNRFRNLQSVSFGVTSNFSSIRIDNVVLSDASVPEPATWVVMAGLALVGFARRARYPTCGA